LLGSIVTKPPTWLLGSIAMAKGTPSADSDKLEHIFELPPSSCNPWIKALETRIPSNTPEIPAKITVQDVLALMRFRI